MENTNHDSGNNIYIFLTLDRIGLIKHYFVLTSLSLLISILVGCYPGYQSAHEQGNVFESADISQLHVGMTKREVQKLLGTPAVQDPFHKSRWDYIYVHRAYSQDSTFQILSLFFDDEILMRTEHKPSMASSNHRSISTLDRVSPKRYLERIWKSLRLSD
ncbi:MAG: hypothetical protein CL398_03870 [Acidiferrobacteraceae bacterium]|nr:hypothetical protein [Acidiferrobacteraceae bacterium]